MPQHIEQTITERQIICKHCGSTDVWKSGFKDGNQYYKCKKCGHRFIGKDTLSMYKYDKKIITRAMEFFYGGMSLRKVQNKFDDLDQMHISKTTIWNWVMHFTNLVIEYTKSLRPTKISDSWFVDETMIKVHGRNKWLWALIDEDTRYLLACNFTTTRTSNDATKLFKDAKHHAGRKPFVISTDKLKAYQRAFNRVFQSIHKDSHHLQSEGFPSPNNTNLIERWHEYVKGRTKIMRHFKTSETAFTVLQGIIINYNFLWEHSAIGDITPAQKAGLDIEGLGINNWGDLIRLAESYRTGTNVPWSGFIQRVQRAKRATGSV